MSLSQGQIIHIVVELVLIGALAVFCITKINNLQSRVQILEQSLHAQRTKAQVLEVVLQEVVKTQRPEVRTRISHKVQEIRQQNPGNQPVNVQIPPVQQASSQIPQRRGNPLESIMSMMAPMMSTLIVGSGEEDSPSLEKHEDPDVVEVTDEELAEELSELKESTNEKDKHTESDEGKQNEEEQNVKGEEQDEEDEEQDEEDEEQDEEEEEQDEEDEEQDEEEEVSEK